MTEHHPSALRNRGPIADKLKSLLQFDKGNALEIASGTGAHLELFAENFPDIQWQPTEYIVDSSLPEGDIGRIGTRSAGILETLDKIGKERFKNVRPASALDVSKEFPQSVTKEKWNLVFLANVLHISPIECTHGLLSGAGKVLKDDGVLIIYGPFKRDGQFTGDGGNERFDASLKERNPLWGYRDIEFVAALGKKNGLNMTEIINMPANNFMLCLEKINTNDGEKKNDGDDPGKM
jgi:hypothetical protein